MYGYDERLKEYMHAQLEYNMLHYFSTPVEMREDFSDLVIKLLLSTCLIVTKHLPVNVWQRNMAQLITRRTVGALA